MPAKLTLTVTQLNTYVQHSLQGDPLLRDVSVVGEISNLKIYSENIIFFTLKDEQASLSCIAFEECIELLSVLPFDGMRIVARGSVSLYVKDGQYRLNVRRIEQQGLGVLYERLQRLRKCLEREGLFSEARKVLVPRAIDTLGVVTSPTGSVIHDILNVSLRRDPQVRILLCPAKVQGIGAAEEVARGIRTLEAVDCVSVVVVARGGGSLEDLWAFNEEVVVRAVALCGKPVISAVGHETDITLCDLAADLRAPTPSAAAELAVPLRQELEEQLRDRRMQMRRAILKVLEENQGALHVAKVRLAARSPAAVLGQDEVRLRRAAEQLSQLICARLRQEETALAQAVQRLELVTPYSVLRRGYVLAEKDGKPITSVKVLKTGDRISLRFEDGRAEAVILSWREEGSTGNDCR